MTNAQIAQYILSLNLLIKGQGAAAVAKMKQHVSSAGVRDTGRLQKSIKVAYRLNTGTIDRLSFQAERYGFVLSNVGKKYTVNTSAAKYVVGGFTNVNGRKIPIIESAKGRKINERSSDADWFWGDFNEAVEALANMVTEFDANLVVKASIPISNQSKR